MLIELKYCKVRNQPWGVTTYFPDGAESSIWPQDTDEYRNVVESLGFKDQVKYAQQHDFCHSLLAEAFFDKPSYVVWNSAQGLSIDPDASAWEERLVYYFQQYLAGLIPAIDPQWANAKRYYEQLVGNYIQ